MATSKKSYLNWVPGKVLGYGPPHPVIPELVADRQVIRTAQKQDRKRHTVRVKSHLP